MSDTAPVPAPETTAARSDDRTAAAIVYGLYLFGYATAVTPLIGLIVAYVSRSGAGPVSESHLTFAIRTFWLSFAWLLIAAALFIVGTPLTLLLVGFLMWWAAWAIVALFAVWFAVRCVLGVIYLARGEAYPRPQNWLF